MTMNRHEPFEELISASLTDDLSAVERQRLDTHLDSCAECRATLAAFADQRRIMSGLRHVGPPRDLGARVRGGIERGRFATLPWWRRPAVIFTGVGGGLAAVAGALLAIVLLNAPAEEAPVGAATPSPTPVVSAEPTALATVSAPVFTQPPEPPATLPPVLTPPPSVAPGASVPPSTAAPTPPTIEPTAAPEASPEPDIYLAYTGPIESPTMAVLEEPGASPVAEVEPPSGPPVAAELSPDGQWLAYITQVGQRGTSEVRATRIAEAPTPNEPGASPALASEIAVGETVVLGESLAGSPFLERMAWSPDARYLAFTLADPETAEADAWLFEPANDPEPRALTDVGDAYAASWVAAKDGSPLLWISAAGDRPASHLHAISTQTSADAEPIDPTKDAIATAGGVFQPLLSPNGAFAIYWDGRMEQQEDEAWTFVQGGAPYLAAHDVTEGTYEFSAERLLFSDLDIGQDAFAAAAIAWGGDGDAYAVWDSRWTGRPQSFDDEATYPDQARVYFGHATDPRGLTRIHAIDAGDLRDQATVVDVKVSPTGRHLVITALRPLDGTLSEPMADLLLVTRNTGDVPDEVQVLASGDDGWFGPAAFAIEALVEAD